MRCLYLLAFAIAIGTLGRCLAQDAANTTESSESKKDTLPAEVQEALNAFRQIVCDAAIDVDSPLHPQGLLMAVSHRFTDPRFDDFIRQALSMDPQKTDHDDRYFAAARQLMPLSTIAGDEQVRLLFGKLQHVNDYVDSQLLRGSDPWEIGNKPFNGIEKTIAAVKTMLSGLQDELHAELKQRLSEQSPPVIVVAMTSVLKQNANDLLPDLARLAMSQQVPMQKVALHAIDRLTTEHPPSPLNPSTVPIDDKALKYAEKIIARYDTNKDGVIVASEWKTMLMDPSPADANRDGRITVEEYGSMMQSRSKR